VAECAECFKTVAAYWCEDELLCSPECLARRDARWAHDRVTRRRGVNAQRARDRRARIRAQQAPHTPTCTVCGQVFRADRSDAVYCLTKCRMAAYRARR
jgi:ribosomal protein L32